MNYPLNGKQKEDLFMKKLVPFILGAVALPAALLSCAFDAELPEETTEANAAAAESSAERALLKTIATAPAMYDYICLNYGNPTGPISITKGTLKTFWSTKTMYLVALSGTEMKSGQATGIVNDLQAGFSIDGAYVNSVVSSIQSCIPAGSNIVFAGHSLGGMVAQQVSANDTIKKKYTILNTVTFGAPLITFIWREGSVQRLGDKSDIIPTLSISSLFTVTAVWNVAGLNREDGGYGINLLGAHKDSYARTDVWGRWNAIGYKDSTGTITLDLSTKRQCPAPAGWNFF